MDKIWPLNRLAISQSALEIWELLFLTVKYDLKKKIQNQKCPKQEKKKMFCYPTQYHLSMQGACSYCHQKGRKQFLSMFKVSSLEYEKYNLKKQWTLNQEVIRTLNLNGGHYLILSTQEIEIIGLEESTISYFAFMSQLIIFIENPNNYRIFQPHIELLPKTSKIIKTPSPNLLVNNKVRDLLSTKKFQPITRPFFKT